MKRIWVYDIEILLNCHTATFLAIDNQEVRQFVIHKSRNDFSEYIKFLQTEISGLIGFNNINYDYPILHYLLTFPSIETTFDYCFHPGIPSIEEKEDDINWLTRLIYDKSNNIIDSEWSSIPDDRVLIPQLDLYRTNHFDNVSKRTSLKKLEIVIDFPNVEDMPFKPSHYVEDNEVEQILSYNLNDVLATYEFYKLNIDEIEMRRSLGKEFGIDVSNANEPKIGSEIFAKLLSESMGISIKNLKKLRTYRESINLSDCIIPEIHFSNSIFTDLLNDYKSKVIVETKNAIEESVEYKGFTYDYGLGGLHGCIEPGVYKAEDGYVIHDIDVASFYPNIAINNGFKPEHLGETFTTIYNRVYHERKSAPKGSAKNGGLKLAINGVFGKSNDEYSFFYDPMFTMQITVNGQLLLTMLAEKIVDNIECTLLQANTDGITLKYKSEYSDKVFEIMKWWEDLTKLQLESAYYKLMVIRDVNNYLAVGIDNKPKYKGAFEIVPMANGKKVYWKNISMRIVPMALSEYYINNIPIEDTIINHTNIYNFCMRVSANKGWWLEERYYDQEPIIPIFNNKDEQIEFVKEYEWIESGNLFTKEGLDKGVRLSTALNQSIEELKKTYQISNKLSKNVRYYVSTNGNTFIKCNEDGRETSVEKGYLSTVFNRYVEKPMSEYNINYDYYINECNKIIKKIEK